MKMNQKKLNEVVGNNIKKYRKLYCKDGIRMTQEMLAEKINVSLSLISGLESKKTIKGISIQNLYKISVVLEIPINKFFEDNND